MLTRACALVLHAASLAAQTTGFVLVVEVRSEGRPVAGALVSAGGTTLPTDASGTATLPTSQGALVVTVAKEGFTPATSSVNAGPEPVRRLIVSLERQPAFEEEVTVTATRTNKRVEDQPMRVEVVPGEEVQEKIMMAPGSLDVLNETNASACRRPPSRSEAPACAPGVRGATRSARVRPAVYGGPTAPSAHPNRAMDLGRWRSQRTASALIMSASRRFNLSPTAPSKGTRPKVVTETHAAPTWSLDSSPSRRGWSYTSGRRSRHNVGNR